MWGGCCRATDVAAVLQQLLLLLLLLLLSCVPHKKIITIYKQMRSQAARKPEIANRCGLAA